MINSGSPLLLRRVMVAVIIVACMGCRGQREEPAVAIQSPQASHATIEQARGLFERGRRDEALQLAQEVLIAEPENINALRIIAAVHASNGDFRDAAGIAVTLSTLEVPDPVGESLLAFDWHLRGGDPQAAEQDLTQALERSPEDPRLHRALAELLNAQGRRVESRPHVLALRDRGPLPRVSC